MKELQFKYMDFINVNIKLRQPKTVLNGDSATGKSYLYHVIEQYTQDNNRTDILCLNIDNVNLSDTEYIINKISKIENGIIVIDQADDILSDNDLWDYVMCDNKNYYIIFGRNYYTQYTELAMPKISSHNMEIEYKIKTAYEV